VNDADTVTHGSTQVGLSGPINDMAIQFSGLY